MKKGTFLILALLVFVMGSCKKDMGSSNCFDKDLQAYYKDKACLGDCPGITGCDGKFYCNECNAGSVGIRPK
jgi:hypothetical protein